MARGLRRREATMAVACVAHDRGVAPRQLVGAAGAKKAWRESEDSILVPVDFTPLRCNPLGGYGQFYAGSLYRLGLTHTPNDRPGVDELTPEGRSIADALGVEIGRARYVTGGYQSTAVLPKPILIDLGSRICLCRAPNEEAADREPLRELFLALGPHATPDGRMRREALLLCLDVIARATELGKPIPLARADASIANDAVYYGQIHGPRGPRRYKAPPALQTCASRWRLLALHRQFSHAMEHVLAVALAAGSASPTAVLDQVDWRNVAGRFSARVAGTAAERLAQWIEGKPGCLPLSAEESQAFDRGTGLRSKACEETLVRALRAPTCPGDAVALAVELLVVLHARFQHARKTSEAWREIAEWVGDGLWFEPVAARMEASMVAGEGARALMTALAQSEVVPRLGSRLIGRGHSPTPSLRARAHQSRYRPPWRDAKIQTCVSILRDLGLLTCADGMLGLTRDGVALRSGLIDGCRSERS